MDKAAKDIHEEIVDKWLAKNNSGLTTNQLEKFMVVGIQAIQTRAQITLSDITLLAIIDRVLYQSKKKFPSLDGIEMNSKVMSFAKLNYNNENDKSLDLLSALQFILVELLRVLGRITAEILTVPLHRELLNVTWNDSEKI